MDRLCVLVVGGLERVWWGIWFCQDGKVGTGFTDVSGIFPE